LVDEVKNHLVASGKVTKENADRVIQSPADALAAYEGVKVAGIVQMPDPATMLTNALTRFRGKFGAAATGATTRGDAHHTRHGRPPGAQALASFTAIAFRRSACCRTWKGDGRPGARCSSLDRRTDARTALRQRPRTKQGRLR
jgi:hypothetical protein